MPRTTRSHGFSQYTELFPGHDITAAEWEFLAALRDYQTRYNRRYPSGREILAVLVSLGYRKVAEPTALPRPDPEATK